MKKLLFILILVSKLNFLKKSFIKKFGFFYRYQIKKQFKNKKINLIGSDKKMFYDLLTKFDFDTTKVADFLGCSRDAVVWWTNANLITLRRNKYKLNNQVFQKANEESAYWAGVISADGCIKEIGKSKNRMLLELTSTDKILIDKFKEFGFPILVGASRKRFLGGSDPIERESASIALTTWLATKHIWGVRTHTVKPHVDAIKVIGQLS